MKEIPGYPGYFATSEGNIWSDRSQRELKQHIGMGGYMATTVQDGSGSRRMFVHALVCMAFHGPRPEGCVVRHKNGNQLDNRPENLRWGTKSQNSHDRVLHGRHYNSNKTHCQRGHPLSGDNLYRRANGSRECRACRKAARGSRR